MCATRLLKATCGTKRDHGVLAVGCGTKVAQTTRREIRAVALKISLGPLVGLRWFVWQAEHGVVERSVLAVALKSILVHRWSSPASLADSTWQCGDEQNKSGWRCHQCFETSRALRSSADAGNSKDGLSPCGGGTAQRRPLTSAPPLSRCHFWPLQFFHLFVCILRVSTVVPCSILLFRRVFVAALEEDTRSQWSPSSASSPASSKC